MKVLFMVPYIYKKEHPEFTRNSTGFGILVNQIYECVGKEHEAYLTSYVLTQGHGNILPHTLWQIFTHLHVKDVIQGIRMALRYKQSLGGRLRHFYSCINKGYLRHIIRKTNPDVVHIHGVGTRNAAFFEVCRELNVKHVVTLHGLIGLSDSVKAAPWDKEHEKVVLLECEKLGVPVTVISTGMKRRIEEHYLQGKSKMINVVTNGTNVAPHEGNPYADLRKTYKIPETGRIAVSAGSLCFRKNQLQIVEAMDVLLKKGYSDLYVFLCGTEHDGGAVRCRIAELGLENRVIPLGFVPYEQMTDVFQQAEMTILASIDEGFGLSIIEGFVHGLPAVTFADLDAVPDLYHKNAMVLSEDRSTESLANAIAQALNTSWDGQWIREYSKQFSLEEMAKKYCAVYQSAVKK